ncbi:MAG: hypothetical protein ABSE18_04590 [Minisyncoccia bacterium]|jgi:hypothetical protein
MTRVIFVVVAIFILGALVYVFSTSHTNFKLFPLLPPAPSSSYQAASSTQSYAVSNPASTTITATPTSSSYQGNVPAGFTADELSPYYGQVSFGGVSPAYSYYDGSYGEISLDAYSNDQSSSIDVTGWEIKGNEGGEYIPQAVNIYDPLGLNPSTDIFLKSGDYLNLYSGSAPVNLRLNECVGYLPNQSQFNPALPENCPSIDQSEIQTFSGACQNYILSLGSCESPDFNSFSIPQNDSACLNYLNTHFNYLSCFNAHYSDSNFLSNEVRVWMGSSPIDQFHDRVELLDRNGLLVDLYTY